MPEGHDTTIEVSNIMFFVLYTQILKQSVLKPASPGITLKNGNRIYKYLVSGHKEAYFMKEHSDSKSKYSEDDIIKILEFLLVVFAGNLFRHSNWNNLCPSL